MRDSEEIWGIFSSLKIVDFKTVIFMLFCNMIFRTSRYDVRIVKPKSLKKLKFRRIVSSQSKKDVPYLISEIRHATKLSLRKSKFFSKHLR